MEAVDVLENGGFGPPTGFPRPAPDQPGLQGYEEACFMQTLVPEVESSHLPPRHSWRAGVAAGSREAGRDGPGVSLINR